MEVSAAFGGRGGAAAGRSSSPVGQGPATGESSGGSESLAATPSESPNMSHALHQHEEEDERELSDFTLVVQGREFHVSRWMLARCSTVFRDMFRSGVRNSRPGEEGLATRLEVNDVPAERMSEFLALLLPYARATPCVTINEDNVEGMLQIAHKYNVPAVVSMCDEYLASKPSLRAALLADAYNLNKAVEACMAHLSNPQKTSFKDLQDPKFGELPGRVVQQVWIRFLKARGMAMY
eukprot:jgi/Chlat1/6495/Chrsp45S05983